MSPDPVIYNTESRLKEPLAEQEVGLYVCGVTPYDTAHLGHAFTYTVFDVLVRYLRFLGKSVTYVQNVTDIDDDVLLRSSKLGVDWKELGDREYARFREAMATINNLPPDVTPRATDHIGEMVQIIARLLAKEFAYERNGSVYFEVARDKRFGRLSRLGYEAQLELANERGNFPADPNKKDPQDFVLWQGKKAGEPAWPSPWGEGRPGWHIECSAMSMRYLGETVTVHGGGEDLIFPHHDAEIAQSENYTGKPFVRHWMHTGMVFCGEHKMSKSLGNMIFVPDLLRICPADGIRLYLLSHHYRGFWNFDRRALAGARRAGRRLAKRLAGCAAAEAHDISEYGRTFLKAISDDLNIPPAIDELHRLADGPPSERRVAKALGEQVIGLEFES